VGHEALPQDFDIEEARVSERVYFIKTHGLPTDVRDKAIYLLRDGRAAAVSFARYLDRYTDMGKTIRDVIYGNTVAGTWGYHVDAWRPGSRPEVMFVRFEDLVDDPDSHADKLQDFLQIEQRDGEVPGFDKLQAVSPGFFSSGRADAWKESLDERFHLAFWLVNGQQMLQYGYTSDQPELFRDREYGPAFQAISDALSFYFKENRGIRDPLVTIDRLSISLAASDQRLQDARSELNALGTERNALLKERHALRTSISWKCGRLLTLPFRAVRDALRAATGGQEAER
jgi:hypothetical protein